MTEENSKPTTAPLPTYLQVEPSAVCNLRCEMCALPYRRDNREGADEAFMPLALFERIIDQLPGATRVHLQGLGEPLLNREFFRMVSVASEKGVEVSANTNLSFLDEQMAYECAASGLHLLHVSVDSADGSSYESIRRGASFERLTANLRMLARVRDLSGSTYPVLRMTVVVMRRNLHDLADLVRMASSFGMEEVFVQHLCHSFGEEGLPGRYRAARTFYENQSLLGEEPEEVERSFEEAGRVAKRLGMALRLPNIAARQGGGPRPRCDWPWNGIYVTFRGVVMPCCMAPTPDRFSLGSLEDECLKDIWEGEPYRLFRDRLSSADPPRICLSCSVYSGTF